MKNAAIIVTIFALSSSVVFAEESATVNTPAKIELANTSPEPLPTQPDGLSTSAVANKN